MNQSNSNLKLKLHKFKRAGYRLLRKNQLFDGTVKKLNNLLSRKVFTYLVVSYPKCGRTWLRFMINQGEAMAYDLLLKNTINETRYRKYRVPRAKYIHGNYKNLPNMPRKLDSLIGNQNINGMIFLVRNPERVMISYYNHLVFRNKTYGEANISKFIRDKDFGIANYVNYIQSYYSCIKEYNHLILRYEDLKKNTFSEMKKVFEFFDLDLTEEQIKTIIKNSSFDKMKEYEKSNKFNIKWLQSNSEDPRAAKIRTQGRESLQNYFSKDDLEFIKSYYFSQKTFNNLGYGRSSDK